MRIPSILPICNPFCAIDMYRCRIRDVVSACRVFKCGEVAKNILSSTYIIIAKMASEEVYSTEELLRILEGTEDDEFSDSESMNENDFGVS